MAKEIKFMFDRRFDEPGDDDVPAVKEDMSVKSVDGIPSIAQLLDTLNEKAAQAVERERQEQQEQAESQTPETETPQQTDAPETAADVPTEKDSLPSETAKTETESESVSVENVRENVQAVQQELERNVAPVFSQAEMDTAREAARAEGYAAGIAAGHDAAWKEAMESVEKQNADTLILIENALKDMVKTSRDDGETAFQTALNLSMAVCAKIAPALNRKNALGEIEALLRENFHFLKDEPKISLRLNPALAENIKPALADLIRKESFAGKITVVRDDALPVGDCRVEWKNGGLERNTQDILRQTGELVKLYAEARPQPDGLENNNG